MRQSNALYRLNSYLKREEANLANYWKRDVKNEKAAKTWDDKNLELASIQDEFIEELEREASDLLTNLEVLKIIDSEMERIKVLDPEASFITIELRLNERNGKSAYLNLANNDTV